MAERISPGYAALKDKIDAGLTLEWMGVWLAATTFPPGTRFRVPTRVTGGIEGQIGVINHISATPRVSPFGRPIEQLTVAWHYEGYPGRVIESPGSILIRTEILPRDDSSMMTDGGGKRRKSQKSQKKHRKHRKQRQQKRRTQNRRI